MPEVSPTAPPSILRRVAGGDSGAVQECIDRYGGLVWSLARRFSYTQVDAEDAVQEIFLDVWRSAPRYDPSVASEATFIAMISRRRLIDRRRRQSRHLDTAELQAKLRDAPEPTDHVEVNEEAAAAAKAMESLRPEQQRVLRLSIYQGLSHEKIAEATGLPLGTVKTHVRRGLIRLREMLSANGITGAGANGSADGATTGGGGGGGATP